MAPSIAHSCSVPLTILMVFKLQLLMSRAEPQVPCYFIFGDALVDNGNNNYLYTNAKVNYPPYGVNFPGGNATGRFSNGENSADILGKLLGFADYTPSYTTASGEELLKWVNYGSGGAGIHAETGRNLRNISYTKEYLGKCIYTVGMGSNDYINNYFMPHHYPSSSIYTPDEYADVLIQQYSKQLESLYDSGARKVAVFGLGLIGCAPATTYSYGKNASGCVDKINDTAALFNKRIKPLVDDLNGNLTNAKFIYINTTHISLEDPSSSDQTLYDVSSDSFYQHFDQFQQHIFNLLISSSMARLCNQCFIVYLISYALGCSRVVYGAPQVPCVFMFGDSLADTGNNNDLNTTAKANFPPYGIDFQGGPTGRFTNGRNYADVIGELLGFTSYPLPYVTSSEKNILMGVNYASGGAGILPETGKNLGEIFSFDAQLSNHNVTVSRINNVLSQGNDQNTGSYLNKCIYLAGFGSNDYINNYLMPQVYPTSRLYKPDQFAEILIRRYSVQLTNLYNYGARKIALFGVADLGCSPAIIAMAPGGKSASGCADMANLAVKEFNDRLKPLVDNLNKDLMGANFVYINTTHISMANPALNGTIPPVPCCNISITNGLCVANQAPCADRGTLAFFDAFHPSEKSVTPAAIRAYKAASPLDAYPMDILRLTQIPS